MKTSQVSNKWVLLYSENDIHLPHTPSYPRNQKRDSLSTVSLAEDEGFEFREVSTFLTNVSIFLKDYKPPFTITNEILTYVSSIFEKVGRITATSNMEAKPHLRKNNRIRSIHSSLRIEANSLSLGQVRDNFHLTNGMSLL